MKAFSQWYFGAVSSGLEWGLVLLGILSCVSCPDKSDFTFSLRVSPGLCSSEVLAQPYPARTNRTSTPHSFSNNVVIRPFPCHFLSSLKIMPPPLYLVQRVHEVSASGPAGWYLSSRSHTEAIWQWDQWVTGLTTKVVCKLEPSMRWLISLQKMSPRTGIPCSVQHLWWSKQTNGSLPLLLRTEHNWTL